LRASLNETIRQLFYFRTAGLRITSVSDEPNGFRAHLRTHRHSCLHLRVAVCVFRPSENARHLERKSLMKLNETERFVIKCYWVLWPYSSCVRTPVSTHYLLMSEKVFVASTDDRRDVIAPVRITTQTCGLRNVCLFCRTIMHMSRCIIRYIYIFPHVREILSRYHRVIVRVARALVPVNIIFNHQTLDLERRYLVLYF